MTCITLIHDPFSMCAQKFVLYNINLTLPYIHVACVYSVCLVLFVMLRMEPRMLVCARQLYHWATSQPLPMITIKRSFWFGFCFLVHSFPINILLNSTKAILYITWFLPKNNLGLQKGHRERYPWFTSLVGIFKMLPKADSVWNRSLSNLAAARIFRTDSFSDSP